MWKNKSQEHNMFPSSSCTQEVLLNRRLLQQSPLYHSPPEFDATLPFAATDRYIKPNNGFDANVVMVISVLLCALFCSLGLNSIIRCALNCSDFVARNDENDNRRSNTRTRTGALAKTGVRKTAQRTFPMVSYSANLKLPGLDTECVICLSEFVPAERIRLFPKCNHGFHVRCIDRWLTSHSSCPTCRSCLVETCKKNVGCDQPTSSAPPPPALVQDIIVNVAPLEREDMIHTNSSTSG